MRVVGLSGNFTRPSRTRFLVEAALAEAAGPDVDCKSYDLIDAGPTLGTTTSRENASAPHLAMWEAVQACDALIVGSPVYKASYTGLLKHFFDLLEMDILRHKPVLLMATAKSPQHALMIDHQFRPLFAFFGAVTVPSAVFALDADFEKPELLTDKAKSRVAAAVADLLRMGRRTARE